MPERSDLDRRLRAVERTLTDGDHEVADLAATGDLADRIDAVEERLEDIEERLDELDAATQAVRGYVGNVRAVNNEVEERADAALAAVDRLERRLDEREHATTSASTMNGRATNGHGGHGGADSSGTSTPTNGSESIAGTSGRAGGPTGSIEMRPPSETTSDDGDEDQSVIDRVREAL